MPTLSNEEARARAEALYEARATRRSIAPFTDAEPALGANDGYAIQRELTALLLAAGDSVVGYKAGLTSEPMQQMFGVDTPDYAPVFASTVHDDGAVLDRDAFIAPKVEAEIVFRLYRPLAGPGVTVEDARSSIGQVAAGLEIVDSRISDWRIRLADTVADLASNGAAVLGRPVPATPETDYRQIGVSLLCNGAEIATGTGAAALGDPVAVVAWLANVFGEYGIALDAGQLVMTGALHSAIDLRKGDTCTARFDQLGSVTVHVAEAEPGRPPEGKDPYTHD